MLHIRARRLLFSLPDGTLPPPLEERVWAHADHCRRCQARLRELDACEAMLRGLPANWLPTQPSRASEARLRGLARWKIGGFEPAWRERLALPALSALAAVAGLAVAIALTPGSPLVRGGVPAGFDSTAGLESGGFNIASR